MKAAKIIFMLFVSASLYSQTFIPDDWDSNQPQDTEKHIFSRGISAPKDNEREAIIEAENMAAVQLAQRIWMLIDSRYINYIKQDGLEIRENAIERNYIFSKLVLPNVNRAYKTKKKDDKFIVYCLAYVSRNDAAKAELAAENELYSLYAYNYFAKKIPGLKPFNIVESLDGIDDYHSWVVSNCGILAARGTNQTDYLNQFETFVRIIFPDCISFSARYNGEPARFIYGAEKLDIISRILQRHGISFSREHPRLTVTDSQKLGDLIRMDPSMVYVTGIERVHHNYNTKGVDERGLLGRELIRQIQNVSRKNAAFYTLPARLDGIFENEIVNLLLERSDLPCRYVIVYFVETFIERGRPEFVVPVYLFAEGKVLVYDQILGSILLSENIKNGIPIVGRVFDGDPSIVRPELFLSLSYELLTRRLFNAALIEALSNSMEAGNVH